MNPLIRLLLCAWFSALVWADGLPAEWRERLDRAEDNLRLAEATARRIGLRLEALRADPAADPSAIAAMERYLEEVEALRENHADALAGLRRLAGMEGAAGSDPVVEEGLRNFEGALAALPRPGEPVDEIARIDAELTASLEAFDQKIQEHVREVRTAMDDRLAAAAAAGTGPAQAAAEAAALLRKMGVDPGVGGESGGAGAKAGGAGEVVGTGAKVEGGGASGGPSARRDEDIVARQLREAAEKETDPVLREKLWKEYEDYLSGRS